MRKWKVVALLMAAGLIMAPVAAAQSTQDDGWKQEVDKLRRDLQQLQKSQADLARENAELRGQLKASPVADTSLEERINALAENLDYAGTTVKSEANPITIFGQARIRSGWTFDRDFGADVSLTGGGTGGLAPEDNEDDEGSFVDAVFLVGFDFDLDRDVMVRFSIKANGLYDNGDTNAPDASSSKNSNLGEIDAYELFIELRNIFGRKELGAREGRQEIVLGNEFQFGNNDYFSGETFDGSHWWWDSDNFTLHFLWAKLSVTNDFSPRNWPYTPAGAGDGYDDDELYSLYFTLKSIQDHEIDLYWIYFNGHGSDAAGDSFGTLGNPLGGLSGADFYYHTFGARIGGVFAVAAGLDYNLEFAYQTGDLTDLPAGAIDDVEGFAIEGEVGITFDSTNHFRIYIRGMFAEGSDPDDNDTGYIPLFPERHAHAVAGDHTSRRARYGIMDIIPMANVWTIQLGLTFDPSQDWTLGLTALYAEHDEDVSVVGGGVDDGIGFEIDAFGEYRYSTQTTFSGGIAAFFPDDGAPFANGGFVGNDDDVAFLFFMQARVLF